MEMFYEICVWGQQERHWMVLRWVNFLNYSNSMFIFNIPINYIYNLPQNKNKKIPDYNNT